MKEKRVLVVLLVVFVLAATAIQCGVRPPADRGPVEIGQEAPNFVLPDISGREVSLDLYRGKIVILDFWATWCGPCRFIMPMLDTIQEEYSGKLSVLAINLSEPKDLVRDYILKQNLHSRVVLDEDNSVGDRYGTYAIPMQFLIDQEGVVRQIWTGYSPVMDAQIRSEINKLL